MKLRSVIGITLLICLSACDARNNDGDTSRLAPDSANREKIDTPKAESKPSKPEPLVWPKRENVNAFLKKFGAENPETVVKLKTRLGDIVIKLYEDTPLHRANFLFNAKRGLYDHTIFYRVVPGFMIQGGNSDHEETQQLRSRNIAYYVPSEIQPQHIHKRGAVAMAMSYENNPENKSAQYSFYIVIGKRYTEGELAAVEEEYDISIPDWAKKVYTTDGGTPHLDGKHTVFGEVLEGMEVVEAIAAEERDSGDWPINDVEISIEIVE
ncbi:MAG: peptidylprolyl isomerase [Salibacteraceae bacterium]